MWMARFEHYDPGFSSPETQATVETVKWGVDAEAKVAEGVKAKGTYSETNAFGQSLLRAGEGRIIVPVSQRVDVEPYAKYAEQTGTSVSTTENGARGVAGLQLTYHWDVGSRGLCLWPRHLCAKAAPCRAMTGPVLARAPSSTTASRLMAKFLRAQLALMARPGIEYAPTADDRYNIGYRRDAFRSIFALNTLSAERIRPWQYRAWRQAQVQ